MAKMAFSKLALKANTETKIVSFNDIDIEVKQYLPVTEKLDLISSVLNQAADENNFSNPVKLEVIGSLEIVFAYTNLSFTEKQKEDLIKLYDLMEGNGLINAIVAKIPKEEYKGLIDSIQQCSDAIYTYRNSALGIMEAISSDYSELDFDASKIQNELANPENITLLKDIMSKLG